MNPVQALKYNLLVTFLLATFLPGIVQANERLEREHVIDFHVHVAGLGYGNSGIFVSQDMRDNFRYPFFMKWMGVTEEELSRHGDQLIIKRVYRKIEESRYVDQAVILALDGVIDKNTGQLDKKKTHVYIPNNYVASQTARYRSLLYGASINPARPNSLALLKEAHKQGAVLIKWIPSIMHIDPADERHIPFYRLMAELDLPLLSHTGAEKSFTSARDELADPRRLELALKQGVTVIAAHLAATGQTEGQDHFDRLLPMFEEYDNLYADISSLTQINKLNYLARALEKEGVAGRLIYGSDWPILYFLSPAWIMNGIAM